MAGLHAAIEFLAGYYTDLPARLHSTWPVLWAGFDQHASWSWPAEDGQKRTHSEFNHSARQSLCTTHSAAQVGNAG